ncbi:hypothetical protein JH06_0089 [Blastocystis sp. subtype 4]|uniref:hypothetical protein n=1 Tax=Blastocystis sp. subtype 4 TaxID=944170 RepID=UPI0007117815|nr:hypothetical protein JH06_0089 [Blastocystis sp. subtype 4]KNB46557.1 hypothetical protein JH06_0089 [Blastocystis sp. subtype 4]|eukprot:XP_014530000.1 hypothetical protein JH06_0089 [Blastocystis sp. subtype 4]
MENNNTKVENQVPSEPVEEKTTERLCYICQKPGHLARNCPEKDNAPQEDGKKEHFVPRRRGFRRPRRCFNCGETGHVSKDCPKKVTPEEEK